MANKIILPTDFSLDSLNLVIKTLELIPPKKMDIVFIYGVYLPESITELLFFSEVKLLNKLYSSDYDDALKIIENKYVSKINSIKFRLFSGMNKTAFQHLLENENADCSYIPKNYKMKKPHKRSFDIIPYLQRSSLKVVELDWLPVINGFGKGHFSENTSR